MLPMEREKAVQKSACQMLALIIAQLIYLTVGSAVFMFLERDSSQKGYNDALEALQLIRRELNLTLTPHQEDVLTTAFGKGISFYAEELPPSAKHSWDFISTLYFSITSTTTIGYGHHSPRTGFGQLFCMAFSLVGIPLHMVTLGTIGKHLNTVISKFLNKIAGDFISKGQGKKDIGTFGVTCTLLILFVIFSAGSVRLVMGEDNVSYIEAIYFIYITISTIGFGDFVIRFEDQADYNRILILVTWVLALYIGMSILSATLMSIRSRAKMSYSLVFGLWDRLVYGKKYRKPHRARRSDSGPQDGLITVDVKFLVEQLDLQTDPGKRAEIQGWIDTILDAEENSDWSQTSDWSSHDPDSDYSPAEDNETGNKQGPQ